MWSSFETRIYMAFNISTKTQIGAEKNYLRREGSAWRKARQIKKKPPISPLEDSASLRFFWGNTRQSCFFHVSGLNLVSSYQVNINKSNAYRFPSLRQKKNHVQTCLAPHSTKCAGKMKRSRSDEPFLKVAVARRHYLGGAVFWGSSSSSSSWLADAVTAVPSSALPSTPGCQFYLSSLG